MFIAMNRFKVIKGQEQAFEQRWLGRDSYLDQLPGFIEFHLLRGPERDDHTLYSSHTTWASKQAFTAWTQSEQFRAAHRNAGENKALHLGHPEFRGIRGGPNLEEARSEGNSRVRVPPMPARTTTIDEIRAALEAAGVIFVEENGDGVGSD